MVCMCLSMCFSVCMVCMCVNVYVKCACAHICACTCVGMCLLLSVSVLPACMHVCDVCAWCVWRSGKGMDVLEMELQVTLSQHVGIEPGSSVRNQQVLFTTEQTFYPPLGCL